ncbi:MAG: Ig-like domain repeat protein [Dokdonella sp.]
MVRLPDGSIVLGGYFSSVNGADRKNIAKLRPDGTLDPDWTPQLDGVLYTLVSDGNGSIYLGGWFTKVGGRDRQHLAKIAESGRGDVDESWNPAANSSISALALDGAGSIYVGGGFGSVGGLSRRGIARLSTEGSGSADPVWNPSPNGSVNAIALNSAHTVYVGGTFTNVGGQNRKYLASLSTDGAGPADVTWNPSPDYYVNALLPDANGNVYAGGSFFAIGGGTSYGLARLAASGSGAIDPLWAPQVNGQVSAMALDGSGNIYIGGMFTLARGQVRNNVAKLSTSGVGTPDPNWNPSASGEVRALVLNPDNTICVGGSFSTLHEQQHLGLGVITTDGTLSAIQMDIEYPGYATSIARQPNGGVIVGGEFRKVGQVMHRNILRLRPDRTLDLEWNPDPDGFVSTVLADPDGSVYVGGYFSKIGGKNRNNIAKISGEGVGASDDLWNPNADYVVQRLVMDASRNIYAGGAFSSIGAKHRAGIAKLSADGTGVVDATWNPTASGGTSGASSVSNLALDGGYIYAGGDFNQIGGLNRNRIAKLSVAGAGQADPAWNPAANSYVQSIAVDTNGSVYVGGVFTNIGGANRNYIAKLSGNGSGAADVNWNPAADNVVSTLALDGTGHVFVGGSFTIISGSTRRHVAKLSTSGNGSADANWNPSADDSPLALAFDGHGTAYIGGQFTEIGGARRGGIAAVSTEQWVTSTAVTSMSPTTTVAGQSYAVSVSVSSTGGVPSGSVVVSDDQGASCGPITLSAGVGSCTLFSLVAGNRTLTATYMPDSGAFSASGATATHQVSKAATETSGFATPNNSAWGQSVTYTAYVSAAAPGNGNPSGNVQISDGASGCTAQISDGAASCSLVPSLFGSYSVSLSYLGDGNFNPSNGAASGVRYEASTNVAMLPISPSTVVVGQPVILDSDVFVLSPGVGPATGSVSINNGHDGCGGVVDANGHATCVARFTSAGWYSVHAFYLGDTHRYLPSNSGIVQLNVDFASTTTAITTQAPITSAIGESVSFGFSATAVAPSTGIPTGNVTVGDGSQSCTGALDVGGNGSCAIAFTSAGTHHVVASYLGAGLSYLGSTSPNLDHVVNPTATTLSIATHTPDPSTPAQSVSIAATFSASGSGTPTGPITIGDGVDSCAIAQGGTNCALTLTTRGPRTLTASYAGDSNFSASSAQVTHHVNRLPLAGDASYATNEDAPLTVGAALGVLASASDPDGDTLTIINASTLDAAGIGGSVVLNANGSFAYTPPADANGVATFEYTISDGLESVTATATITVGAVNDPPSFALATIAGWPAGTSGAQVQSGFASVTSMGAANESSQGVQAWHVRTISDSNGVANSMSIALDGTLAYTLSGHAGSATFGLILQDDGGTANGGNDSSPEQTFTITVAAGLDLSISIDDDTDFAPGGGIVVYAIFVHNAGPNDAVDARVMDLLPSSLVNADWTCEASVGASCTASGSGDIDDTVAMPSGTTLTYVLSATVVATPEIPLENTATVSAPANAPDTNAANNAATDTDAVGIFADGFDKETVVAAGDKASSKVAGRIPRSNRFTRAAMTFSHARAFPSAVARGA